MELSYEAMDLRLVEPLRISNSTSFNLTNVIVRLEHDGLVGLGEAAPSAKFGETPATVIAALELFRPALRRDPSQREAILAGIDKMLEGNHAAKTAVDLALHDLAAKKMGVPLYGLLGLDPAATTFLTYTIGIDTVDAMVRNAVAASRKYKYLKVKFGCPYDREIIEAISAATPAIIRADVNGGWTARYAVRFINDVLTKHRVEFVEQPLHPADLKGMELLYRESALPLVGDESIGTVNDIVRLADRLDGVNIKLMKCGGIRPALQMIATARALGLKVMLGCRTETSLAITAAVHLSPLADFADLDLHLMLERDPFLGATIDGEGRFVLPTGKGLGVTH
jgi:L-alanine-DL-glutamate epimerase-like enolase superfamily enzyme